MEKSQALQEIEQIEKDRASQIVAKIGEQNVTHGELKQAFELVQNKDHWKNPFVCAVHHSIVSLVVAAVEYFHADKPEICGIQPLTGYVIIRGHGYQA